MRVFMNKISYYIKVFCLFTATFLIAACSCQLSRKLLVVNVLDQELYNDCHIAGSINVPFDQLEDFAQKTSKGTPIVLYCSNYRCTASGIGARMLKNLGFSNVAIYEGGTAEWYQKKLPVQGPCKQAYLTMENQPVVTENDGQIPVLTCQQLQEKLKNR